MSLTSQEVETLLKPFLGKFDEALKANDFDTVMNLYHPNGVLIETDKTCTFGRKAIGDSFRALAEQFGKSSSEFLNVRYEGVGDYLLIHADYTFQAEKAGSFKGKFKQIWTKSENGYLIYHDEFDFIKV